MPKPGTSATPLFRSDGAPDERSSAESSALEPEPLAEPSAKRKLTTILSADVKAFSRLMEADEEGTLRILKSYRAMIDDLISRHDGRVVGAAGDSVLAEFTSPVEAARCAVEIQDDLARRNAELLQDRRLEFRIGINLGDVIVEGGDLFGDGVNIAARLQQLADPGGIFVSGGVYDQIKTKLAGHYEFLGAQRVKNITEPVRIYRFRRDPAGAIGNRRAWRRWREGLIAAGILLTIATALAVWQAAPILLATVERITGGGHTLPATDRASIAVLPFANQGETHDEYFSDGLTEDLISALGRFSGIRVLSWNAVAFYKNQSPRPDQLARELSVRYVVDGSVRRSGDRVRVTVRLSDAERGTLLWSERYEEPANDIFAVQDRVTRRIVGTLTTRVSYIEQERASAKRTDSLDAYDLNLRGRQSFRLITRTANLQAQEMFNRAIALDPRYADAYAMLAGTYIKSAEMGWTEWPGKALKRGHELAQTALRLDPSNELAHMQLAIVYTYQRQYELALAELQRAKEANPNYTGHYAERGWVLVLTGHWDDAIAALEEALRYDPNPTPTTLHVLTLAYYFRERSEEAVVKLEGAIGRYPYHVPLHVTLAAAYAELGRMEEAARAAANVRRLSPFFTADGYGDFIRNPADRDRLRKDLRTAGL